MTTPRPVSYGWVDKNKNNQYPLGPEIPQANNGYANGDIPLAQEFNTFGNRHAAWAAHLDSNAMRASHIMGDSALARLSGYPFQFAVSASLTSSLMYDSAYAIDGSIVDLPIVRVAALGYSPFLFTANRWTHWYIDKDGVYFSVVSVGVAAAPGAGQYHLGTAVTNGSAVTSWIDGVALFATRRFPIVAESVELSGSLTVVGSGTFEDAVSVGAGLSVLDSDITLRRPNAGTAKIDFTQAGTTSGWRLTNDGELRFYQVVSGVEQSVLRLGDVAGSSLPVRINRAVSINSAETLGGMSALTVSSTGGGPGSMFTAVDAEALTARATGTGAAFRLYTHTTVSASNPVGSMGLSTDSSVGYDLHFKDHGGTIRRAWASTGGQVYSQAFTATQVNNSVSGGSVQSMTVAFVSGKKYIIRGRCRAGRFTGSTRDLTFSITVNAVALTGLPETVSLFQTGGATQLEHTWFFEVEYIPAATASYAVALLLGVTGGAGNINYAGRGLTVVGAYD